MISRILVALDRSARRECSMRRSSWLRHSEPRCIRSVRSANDPKTPNGDIDVTSFALVSSLHEVSARVGVQF